MSIVLKSKAEIELMRRANLVVRRVLCELCEAAKPGVTTLELDEIARKIGIEEKVEPAFLGYPSSTSGGPTFPGVICASVNSAIVHGVPNDTPLVEGDILSVDYGCNYEGFFGDSATTVAIGEVSGIARQLMKTTKESLDRAIEQCQPGKRLGDIGHAVQSCVESAGFSVVKDFVGHGIGRQMHEAPQVPNFGKVGQGRVLKPGLVIAIEPMVTVGAPTSHIEADGWTAVTKDGGLAAHYEHSVAILEKGALVLSQ